MEDYRSIAGHLQVRIFICCGDEEASGADRRFGAVGLGRIGGLERKDWGGSAVWSGSTGADRRFGAEALGRIGGLERKDWGGSAVWSGRTGAIRLFGTEAVFAKIFVPERGRNQSGVKKNCAGLGESRYRS